MLPNFFRKADADAIRVTRSPQGIHFHLPSQRPPRQWSWLVCVTVLIGSYAIFVFIYGTLRRPEAERDYVGMSVGVALTLIFTIAFSLRWRIAWHYELLLNLDELRVYYVSSRNRYLTALIPRSAVQQLTLVRVEGHYALQAEGNEGETRLILRADEPDMLQHLAQLLGDEAAVAVVRE